MRSTKRHLWGFGGAAGALALVGVTAYFPAPSLGEEFAKRAEDRLGITLDVSRSSFSLTRGIALKEVTASASGRNLVLSAEIDRLVATPQLTLRGPRRIETIRLIRPDLTAVVGEQPHESREAIETPLERLDPGTDGSAKSAAAMDDHGGQLGDMAIYLERGTIEIGTPRANTYPLRADGLDIELRHVRHDRSARSLVHALAGVGTLRAAELWIGPVLVMNASSQLTLGDGHFLLSDLAFGCGERHFLLPEVDIDFTSDPFSFGTRGSILERVQPGPDGAGEWVPLASLTELDGLCDE